MLLHANKIIECDGYNESVPTNRFCFNLPTSNLRNFLVMDLMSRWRTAVECFWIQLNSRSADGGNAGSHIWDNICIWICLHIVVHNLKIN